MSTTPQQLPRHTESGMRTRAVNAAAGVLLAAMQQGRQTPTGLALALDSARLLNSPEHAAEDVELRARFAEAAATVAELEAELYTEQAHGRTFLEQRNAHAQELLKLRPALREAQAQIAELEARVAELENEAAGQRRAGYQVAINVMRQEKLPMSVGLLEAQLELEAFDHPKPHERPAGAYPPALPWAALMDADDLEGFLEDLVDAASGDNDLSTLTEVEDAIARWRVIGEAQHAHNTAPGPNAEADE